MSKHVFQGCPAGNPPGTAGDAPDPGVLPTLRAFTFMGTDKQNKTKNQQQMKNKPNVYRVGTGITLGKSPASQAEEAEAWAPGALPPRRLRAEQFRCSLPRNWATAWPLYDGHA